MRSAPKSAVAPWNFAHDAPSDAASPKNLAHGALEML